MIHISAVPDSRHSFCISNKDLSLDRDVQRGGGLVGDDQIGLVQQRDRDGDALPHAAGELVRIRASAARPAKGCRPSPAHRGSARARRSRDISSCAVMASIICVSMRSTGFSVIIGSWKIIATRLPRKLRALLVAGTGEVLAIQQNAAADHAAGRIDQAHDRIAGHRFAGTRFADQAQDLSALNGERHIVDRLHHAGLVKKCVRRLSTCRSGSGRRRGKCRSSAFNRGFSTSRSWSATRLIDDDREQQRESRDKN